MSSSSDTVSGEEVRVVALFPREEEDQTEEVAAAEEACRARADGSEASVVEDAEVGTIVELVGAALQYRCASMLPLLVCYAKSSETFFGIAIDVVDVAERYYRLDYANRRTVVRIDGATAELPLLVDRTWQRLVFDLPDALRRAFGVSYFSTVRVTVTGACRLFRLFLAAQDYPDLRLPPHLRLLRSYD